jgi:cyanophycinase
MARLDRSWQSTCHLLQLTGHGCCMVPCWHLDCLRLRIDNSPHDMQTANETRRSGALIAIGGNEDKAHDKAVLKATLAAVAGAQPPAIGVLTAASREPERQWQAYRKAFEDLGADAHWVDIRARGDAECPRRLEQFAKLNLLFMTGGDQERLARLLHGTATHRILVRRQRHDGLVLAGTSAGASILGAWMPGGDASEDSATALDLSDDPVPRGLGFLPGVIIDQHFTQRRRLARLMDLASRHGGLIGLGVDEDTAAVIRLGESLTVVGGGSVTLIDCRTAHAVGKGEPVVSLRRVNFHRAQAGATFKARSGTAATFAAFLP